MYHEGLGFTEDVDGLLWDEEGNRVYVYNQLWSSKKNSGTKKKREGTTQYYIPDSDIPSRYVRDFYDEDGNYSNSAYFMQIPEGVDVPTTTIIAGEEWPATVIKEIGGEILDRTYLPPSRAIMDFKDKGDHEVDLKVTTESSVPWFDPTFPEHPTGSLEGTCSPLHTNPSATNPFLAKGPSTLGGADINPEGLVWEGEKKGPGWQYTGGEGMAVKGLRDYPPFDLGAIIRKEEPVKRDDEYKFGGVTYKLGSQKKVGDKTYTLVPPEKYRNVEDLTRWGFSPKYAKGLMPTSSPSTPSGVAASTPSMMDVPERKQSFLRKTLGRFF